MKNMIQHLCEMTKMTIKEMLRSKGFLFFAIVLPVLTTLLLNVQFEETKEGTEEQVSITVLEDMDSLMAYQEDAWKYHIKVYDLSGWDKSTQLLEELSSSGMFQIFVTMCDESMEKVMDSVEQTTENDKVDLIMILDRSLKEQVEKLELTDGIQVYKTSEDARYEMFSGLLEAKLLAMLEEQQAMKLGVEVDRSLTPDIETVVVEPADVFDGQIGADTLFENTGMFGNALALYTVAFLFAGIMILGTIMTERQNLVYVRILLTNASPYSYAVSKLIVVVFAAVIETFSAILSYRFLVRSETGISTVQFAFVLFGMALIFNALSVSVGICCENTLAASITVFTTWMISALLGGLYFDISNASDTFKRIALLMPQRWGLRAIALFAHGSGGGYPLTIIVVITYVLVITLIGVLGLKITQKE